MVTVAAYALGQMKLVNINKIKSITNLFGLRILGFLRNIVFNITFSDETCAQGLVRKEDSLLFEPYLEILCGLPRRPRHSSHNYLELK